MPLVPFSTFHYLSNECLDLLFCLRQKQVWQALHLNLLICTAHLCAACQVFPAFSKEVWRCPSLLFMFLTDMAILEPVFFSSDKALKV